MDGGMSVCMDGQRVGWLRPALLKPHTNSQCRGGSFSMFARSVHQLRPRKNPEWFFRTILKL